MHPFIRVFVFIHDYNPKYSIMKNLLSLVLVLFFIAGCSHSHSQEEKTVEKSFDGVESIDLNTASGDCIVKKGGGNDVKVVVTYTYDEDDYTPKMDQNGSRLKLEEKFHDNNVRGSSKWELTVPDGLSIEFNSGSGDLELSDLKGEIDFNTGSGDAHIENFDGELKCNSGSGNFELKNIKGEAKVNSGSGDHHISDSDVYAKANTGSGDVKVNDSKGGYKLNTGSGDVEAARIALTEEGNFNTGSGDVEVILEAALVDNVSANSGSGDAVVDFNGNEIEGEVVMTCKKRGGNIKAPFKFDKEEEIDRNGEIYLKKTAKFGSKDILIEVGTGTGTAEIRK
jgi:hypothetical protein